jgi:hypothetical protein
MLTGGRPGLGQPCSCGMALNVPRSASGTTGTRALLAMNAAPSLNGCVQPSRDRVPSG